MTKTSAPWFNEYGECLRPIPAECVADCSRGGCDAGPAIEHWIPILGFTVPREKAISYLAEFGAWPRTSDKYDVGLQEMTDHELAEKVLWLACCEIRESGDWHGLTH